jgi:DNA helicase HerA-like ATPase
MDRYISLPIPGMLNIYSIIRDPEIKAGKIPANHAINGMTATGKASLYKACLNDIPLLNALFQYKV